MRPKKRGGGKMFELDRPEGLLGTILAFEGIQDSMVIVNGPTGCKYSPASASETSYRNRPEGPQTFNPYLYQREFFFCQPRVPCTYMDGNDYIRGTGDKLDRAKDAVMELRPNILGIVNSPGASLIGQDLSLSQDPAVPVVRMESPDTSASMGAGFQDAIISLLRTISPKASKKRKGVNLLGISVWHLGWFDSIRDLMRLLALCEVDVCMTICAGCTVEDIKGSGSAEINAVVHEEFGLRIAEWYEKELKIPYVNPGTPLGFEGTENFMTEICYALGADPSPALMEIKSKRKRAANILSCLESSRRPPKGRTFSVSADGSLTYQVCRFLYDYVGMIPVALNTGLDNTWKERIGSFLSEKGLTVSEDVFNTPADVMISNANMIALAMYRNVTLGGAAVERPGLMNMNMEERPVLGLGGTVRLLDSVLNILERGGQTQ